MSADGYSVDRRGRKASPDYIIGGGGSRKPADKTKEQEEGVAPERPMHPSWEAAKRAKEKRETPVAFRGKKITFD